MVKMAAFVGEESDPLSGNGQVIHGKKSRTSTPGSLGGYCFFALGVVFF
jgi:hypothetical protein